MKFELPSSLKLGSATASAQIEGGIQNHNWSRWCEMGKILDGTDCHVASDHFNRYKEDIDLMKSMNHEVYRMSIEWSRVEPEQGKFSEEGIQHYVDEVKYLIDSGIEPMVTLHHFTDPIWFEDLGSWQNTDAVKYFVRYTEKIAEALGQYVSEWVTINEPSVYAEATCIRGVFPPGETGIKRYAIVARNMILAHIESYKTLQNVCKNLTGRSVKIGVANHLIDFHTTGGGPLAIVGRRALEYSFHDIFLEGMVYGKLKFPLNILKNETGYKAKQGVYSEYIGVNYYSRHMVRPSFNPGMLFTKTVMKENSQYNDLGWELYPEGLYNVCNAVYKKYKLPIQITENGTCDEKDAFRTEFIYNHVLQIKRLVDDGIPVEKYYHWSLMDNFEWAEGLSKRFGLVEIDYDTQERTVRRSGRFYADLIKNRGVTDEMVAEYL